MNSRIDRLVFFIGVASALVPLLYPPWSRKVDVRIYQNTRAWVWAPPHPTFHVEAGQMAIEFFCVLALTVFVLAGLRWIRQN